MVILSSIAVLAVLVKVIYNSIPVIHHRLIRIYRNYHFDSSRNTI